MVERERRRANESGKGKRELFVAPHDCSVHLARRPGGQFISRCVSSRRTEINFHPTNGRAALGVARKQKTTVPSPNMRTTSILGRAPLLTRAATKRKSMWSRVSSAGPALDEDGCVRCPVCSVKFDSEGNLLEHVRHERLRLDSVMISIKKKDVDEQIYDHKFEEERGSSEMARAAKSRTESYQRVQLNHRRRIQGKAAVFQLNRDPGTPSAGSDRQTNGERSPAIAAAVSVTPPTVICKSEHDPNAVAGWLVCKGCETPRDYLQANAKCQHLRCVDCWNKRLLNDQPPSTSPTAIDDEDASKVTQQCYSSEDKSGPTGAAVAAAAGCPVCSAPIENLRDVCL
uniref:C2H2-type domain-containing protein n=1 Tax=Plectus sambesii TaxID=2011161 RepID=A0A914WKE4_9BILA